MLTVTETACLNRKIFLVCVSHPPSKKDSRVCKQPAHEKMLYDYSSLDLARLAILPAHALWRLAHDDNLLIQLLN